MRFTRASMSAAAALLAACGGQGNAPGSGAAPSVSLSVVKSGTYVKRVEAVGRLGGPAGTQSKLSFAQSGILQSVDVRIGEHVVAGEALATLDTGALSLAAAGAQADANAASANLAQARIDRTSTKLAVDRAAVLREQSLYVAGVAALKDVQSARAQLAMDRAEARNTQTQIAGAWAQSQSAADRAALARRDLYNGTLRAPNDGVITAIYKRPGEAVDQTTPAIAIGPVATGQITLDVTASQAAQIHAGDSVAFAVPGTALHSTGRVEGVSTAIDPMTQTAMVTASGFPSGAPAGSAVRASIEVARLRGIVVPQSAVVQDPQTGETLVFVARRNKSGAMKFDERSVTIAEHNGADALVASGLRPGERIASQGGFALLAPSGG